MNMLASIRKDQFLFELVYYFVSYLSASQNSPFRENTAVVHYYSAFCGTRTIQRDKSGSSF